MRVHILQHEPKEWIGCMEPWFTDKGYDLKTSLLFKGEALPLLDDFDWLIIMGGSMSVNDEAKHPWLIPEKALINAAIKANKKVLGICLGGQLIANALGAKVAPNECMEIGWHNINKMNNTAKWMPEDFQPLSWHGETFDLPDNATCIASSEVTQNQAFCVGDKVWALQFHLEANTQSVQDFYEISGNKLPQGDHVEPYESILENSKTAKNKPIMHALLDHLNTA